MTHGYRARSRSALLAAAVLALQTLSVTNTQAQVRASPRPDATTAQSVRFLKAPSDESPAARAQRLKRECRGRPNAGACLGYTR